jgi:transposase
MGLFFKELCAVLDRTRKNWRRHTVVLADNAPYHTSRETLQMFEDLQIPVMFTGPYSYDVCPCELFFALLKSTDINPRQLATGKK